VSVKLELVMGPQVLGWKLKQASGVVMEDHLPYLELMQLVRPDWDTNCNQIPSCTASMYMVLDAVRPRKE
jgi:hypothetical protein